MTNYGFTNCSICEKSFEKVVYNKSICSEKCVRKYRTNKQKEYYKKKNPKIEKNCTCLICNSSFIAKPKSSPKCCSIECSKKLTKIRHANYRKNPEYIKKMKSYDEKHRNSQKKKDWRKKNKEKLSKSHTEYIKNRKKKDKSFHMALTIRSCVGRMIKHKRDFSSKDVINYTPEELKKHLENLFRNGMSWENYGRLGWHVDHIKPLTAFNFFDEHGNVDMKELKGAMSLDNLQPLWYDENIRKGGFRRIRTTFDERKAQ